MTFGHNVFGINGYGVGNHIFRAAGTADNFTGDKVKVFQHCMTDDRFTDGWVKEWGEGEYHGDDFVNDDASALWIPEGYTVVAYRHGKEDTESPDPKQEIWEGPLAIECLATAPYDFNDDISHFSITYADPSEDEDENGETDSFNPMMIGGAILAVVIIGQVLF